MDGSGTLIASTYESPLPDTYNLRADVIKLNPSGSSLVVESVFFNLTTDPGNPLSFGLMDYYYNKATLRDEVFGFFEYSGNLHFYYMMIHSTTHVVTGIRVLKGLNPFPGMQYLDMGS